jgi:hypothetical protein
MNNETAMPARDLKPSLPSQSISIPLVPSSRDLVVLEGAAAQSFPEEGWAVKRGRLYNRSLNMSPV